MHVGQMSKIKTVVLQEVEKLCPYSQDAVFPDILTAEDIIRETFNLKLKNMDVAVYEQLHEAWQIKFQQEITNDVAKMAYRRCPRSFDAMFVLEKLRNHEEWKSMRGEIRESAEEVFKRLSKVRTNLNNNVHTRII